MTDSCSKVAERFWPVDEFTEKLYTEGESLIIYQGSSTSHDMDALEEIKE